MLKSLTRRRPVVIAVVTVLALSATALAYWTTTGSGTGSADAGTSQAVTISQTNTVAGLYPGGPDRDVEYKISNPAPGNQYVASVTASIASVTGGTGGCPASDFTLTQPAAINQDLAPGDTSFSGTKAVKIKLKNLATNQDNCKNVTVNLTFAAS